MPETRNYLELKVPVGKNATWLTRLREALAEEGISVKWQDGWYHITVVFVNDDRHVPLLYSEFNKILNSRKAPSITLDKIGAFTTRGGLQHIVYLASTQPSEDVIKIIRDIRDSAKSIGANYDSDFRLHISLGRIDAHAYNLEKVKNIVEGIDIPPFTLELKEVEYRYFRNNSIGKWRMY